MLCLCCSSLLQTELLDPELNALEYMMKEYTDIPLEKMRSVVSISRWGQQFCVTQQQHHRCGFPCSTCRNEAGVAACKQPRELAGFGTGLVMCIALRLRVMLCWLLCMCAGWPLWHHWQRTNAEDQALVRWFEESRGVLMAGRAQATYATAG
jgi:hypothetical protein